MIRMSLVPTAKASGAPKAAWTSEGSMAMVWAISALAGSYCPVRIASKDRPSRCSSIPSMGGYAGQLRRFKEWLPKRLDDF